MRNLPSLLPRAILFLLLVSWLHPFLKAGPSGEPPWVFLDNATLIFHEAGHFIFLPFGEFMTTLGGSLTQLLVPLVTLVAFYRQHDLFAAAFSLFWLGESSLNLSYYISDARAQILPLLGGDTSGHDWANLLSRMNFLPFDTTIGKAVYAAGILLCFTSLALAIFAMKKDLNKGFTQQ